MTGAVLPTQRAGPDPGGDALPRWPMAALFVGFPVWWLLGLGELAWVLFAGVMVLYLARVRPVRVPRGFGIWFAFLAWMLLSASQVDAPGRAVGFVYRVALYLGATVLFLYVFNARRTLGQRYVLGLLTVFFAWMVLGGYLGLAAPAATIRTPLAYVLPQGLLSNDLVQQMAVRRLTQYNPDAWTVIDPRPSAPFLYTNNWGNAYSMLVPLVVLYLAEIGRRSRRFWPIVLLLVASLVPAFLTLNRGMFVGLGGIMVLASVRFALHGRAKALLGVIAVGLVGVLALQVLPVSQRLDDRLESSGTNESRTTVYVETVRQTLESPFFGHAVPREAQDVAIEIPALGTQGQVWMVLFSHGFVGLLLFLAFLVWLIRRTWSRQDVPGVVMNAVLVAVLVESFFYGLLGVGLGVAMVVAALALRPRPSDLSAPSPGAVALVGRGVA
ncbi:hypothetical protein KIN34_01140 [Cellulomonas sp. DKR-3]|uniref:Ligase n=1 Tax=Cellulomonas fulva TaxID=2835530 RepID=A0ABS5TUS6_9CELL|nr:hypothetical protein [Cellulomonas fulva]MBT0992896.1 hypothetical protein [Cellulomonas fulva]